MKLKQEQQKPSILPYLILGGVLLFTMAIRMRLLGIPLERDEGEYAYVAQQMLQGIPPFKSIYHFKLPGIYAVYAVILSIFGQSGKGIHAGLAFCNLFTAITLFFIAKRFYSLLSSAIITSVFSILTLSISIEGFAANSEHFVLLPALLGILSMLKFKETTNNKRGVFLLFCSGLLLGFSYTVKQHGLFFILFTWLYLVSIWYKRKPLNWATVILNSLIFSIGVILPFGLICLLFLQLGLFEKFWWWTWHYPHIYIGHTSWKYGLQSLEFFLPSFFKSHWLFLLSSLAVGLPVVIRNPRTDKNLFVAGLFIFSLAAVCVGLNLFSHYFLLTMPAIALLTGSAFEHIKSWLSKFRFKKVVEYSTIILFFTGMLYAVISEKNYLFFWDTYKIARNYFGANPFREAVEISKYLAQNTSENDRVFIFGSEPEVYFYSHRRSATGFIYTYEILKNHPFALTFQEQLIREVDSVKPKYILFFSIGTSLISDIEKPKDTIIFTWAQGYVNTNYVMEGLCNIQYPQAYESNYCWSAPENPCAPTSQAWIGIYKRRD